MATAYPRTDRAAGVLHPRPAISAIYPYVARGRPALVGAPGS